jgi:hypothetical protein
LIGFFGNEQPRIKDLEILVPEIVEQYDPEEFVEIEF